MQNDCPSDVLIETSISTRDILTQDLKELDELGGTIAWSDRDKHQRSCDRRRAYAVLLRRRFLTSEKTQMRRIFRGLIEVCQDGIQYLKISYLEKNAIAWQISLMFTEARGSLNGEVTKNSK